MENKKVALVLEGGGLRGVYTTGILDGFLDRGIEFPYVIGVSAGACQGLSYLSKQRGRSFQVIEDYIHDHRYLSLRNYLFHGGIFGMDFMFDEIPNKLIPFDFETFHNTSTEFVVAATDCITGKPTYFSSKQGDDMLMVCRASSSLPLLAKTVFINDVPYFDGGVADAIPVKKAVDDGYEKIVVVLTRNNGYRKKASKKTAYIMKKAYKKYPNLVETYKNRWMNYNRDLDYLEQLEKEGKAFIIRPKEPIAVSRTEKDLTKLKALYDEAVSECGQYCDDMAEWLGCEGKL